MTEQHEVGRSVTEQREDICKLNEVLT